jgi:hypothetical protein
MTHRKTSHWHNNKTNKCKTETLYRNHLYLAVPWLRRLVAGLAQRRPGFDPGSVHVRFVVDRVALEEVFPRVLRFSPVNFIPPVHHYLEKMKNNLSFFSSSSSQVLHNKP